MTVTEYKLAAGELEAVFLPGRGMLGVSLHHRGEELLRRLENLDAAAAKGSTAGIPLLYPLANRLAVPRYRAAGREVTLDPSSPLLHLDDQGIPNGEEQPLDLFDGPLGELNLDAGFVVLDERPQFSLAGAGRRITVEFLDNYRYAQILAPKGKDFVALEPMTAPTNALVSGCDLGLVPPNRQFRAAFRMCVEPTSAPACVSSCQ